MIPRRGCAGSVLLLAEPSQLYRAHAAARARPPDLEILQWRVLQQFHKDLTARLGLEAPIFLGADDDDLLAAVDRDPLRPFALRPPDNFAEPCLRIL